MTFFNVVASIHTAFIICAMPDTKHVSDLMGHDFTSTVEHQVVCLLLAFNNVTIELRTVAVKAEDSSLCHNVGKTKDETKGIIWIDVLSCYSDDTNGLGVSWLIYSKKPTQNFSRIVLNKLILRIWIWKCAKIKLDRGVSRYLPFLDFFNRINVYTWKHFHFTSMKKCQTHFLNLGEKFFGHCLVQRQNTYCITFAFLNNCILINFKLLFALG